jgi:hypothetical protein
MRYRSSGKRQMAGIGGWLVDFWFCYQGQSVLVNVESSLAQFVVFLGVSVGLPGRWSNNELVYVFTKQSALFTTVRYRIHIKIFS